MCMNMYFHRKAWKYVFCYIIFILFLVDEFELSDNQTSDFKAKIYASLHVFWKLRFTTFAKFNSIHCLAWGCRAIIIIKENTASWECLCIRIIKPIIKIQRRFAFFFFFLTLAWLFVRSFSQKLCMHWVTWMRGVNKVKLIYLPMHALKFAVLLSVLLCSIVMLCNSRQDFETFTINKNKSPNQNNIHRSDK